MKRHTEERKIDVIRNVEYAVCIWTCIFAAKLDPHVILLMLHTTRHLHVK